MFINNWNKTFPKFISIWMLLINHIRPTNMFNIVHIIVTAKYFAWSLTHFRPSCWNFDFLDIATILWPLHPMGTDTALEQSSTILVKNVINTCGWSCSCSVCKHRGRLINNLNQITGTGYSENLPLERTAWWKPVNIQVPKKVDLSVYITDTIKHFTHII